MSQRWLFDAYELGVNPKGISRVLASLLPPLLGLEASRVHVAVTKAGLPHLPAMSPENVHVVPRTVQSGWEQLGLPRVGRAVAASAIYSHREAGALWGPPLVLHVPEDPMVRWRRDPPRAPRQRARAMYSRAVLKASLQRAAVVAASTPGIGQQLEVSFGLTRVRTLPLGVDLELFRPAPKPRADHVVHLGSPDPRDRSDLVVEAYALARQQQSLPPLLIAGGLGDDVKALIERASRRFEVPVSLPGRLSDLELADAFRHAAVVIQPSSDEGFGLQPLEALASGAPVVVTDTLAVRDVVGDAAVLVDGTAEALAEAVLQALRSPSLRRAGPIRAAGYSWQAAAERVLTALQDAAHSNPANRRGPRR